MIPVLIRQMAVLGVFTFATAFSLSTAADNAVGSPEIVVAVLDSGVRPTHQEFDYGGPNSTTDQFVGWWDFLQHLPAPGQTWDTLAADPYDDHGHGTGTASLAVGLNAEPTKVPSFCPGCKLAVGKVLNAQNVGSLITLNTAILWAVDEVRADVISISIGGGIADLVPVPGALLDVRSAIEHARDRGVLVVVSAGNGYLNGVGLATPGRFSELYPMAESPDALVVGGGQANGYPFEDWAKPFEPNDDIPLPIKEIRFPWMEFSNDPEVIAHGWHVKLAGRLSDTDYRVGSGTSYATPLVAGMAAKLMETALANGCAPTPDYIETLLKFSARDSVYPYTFEGHGFLSGPEFTSANTQYAPACALPARPLADVNTLYDALVAQTLREVWSTPL